MKNQKNTTKKNSDADKALAKAGEISAEKKNVKINPEISLDTVIAEKDEVKNVEERMRQQNKGNDQYNEKKVKINPEISLDTIVAEKDEVKNAEERMRQQNNENEKKD